MTSHEVTIRAGISYRQLDYWARAGHIPGVDRLVSVGSGIPRQWRSDECRFVVHLARLVNAGISLAAASTALRRQADRGLPLDVVWLSGDVEVRLSAAHAVSA